MTGSELVRDRFAFGWYFPEEGHRVLLDDDPDIGPYYPVAYSDGEAIYAPYSRSQATPTIVCPRCIEPTWHLTRHAVEKHGDDDLEVTLPHPGRTPPDWFQPDWI